MPQYSFIESRRIGYQQIQKKYDYIIVEGLYTINQLKNTHHPFKIFVDTDTEELIFRRIIRDQKRVRESIEEIIGMMGKVFPMRTLYGENQKTQANIIVKNNYQIMKKE
ncbi:MAG: hypothetical protein GXP45_08215 [bacterium]|nr:hypothetical protein [bacterium]